MDAVALNFYVIQRTHPASVVWLIIFFVYFFLLEIRKKAIKILNSRICDNVIVFVVVLSVSMLMFERPNNPDFANKLLRAVEVFVVIFFILEMVLKLIAMGVKVLLIHY